MKSNVGDGCHRPHFWTWWSPEATWDQLLLRIHAQPETSIRVDFKELAGRYSGCVLCIWMRYLLHRVPEVKVDIKRAPQCLFSVFWISTRLIIQQESTRSLPFFSLRPPQETTFSSASLAATAMTTELPLYTPLHLPVSAWFTSFSFAVIVDLIFISWFDCNFFPS